MRGVFDQGRKVKEIVFYCMLMNQIFQITLTNQTLPAPLRYQNAIPDLYKPDQDSRNATIKHAE